MAQTPSSMNYKNVLAWRGCHKLYLDERTADVYFLFRSDGEIIDEVPAHKAILSSISRVFDALFYGSLQQEGDIEIVDATPAAFREFLQFFYRSDVKLTTEHIPQVMNLGKQHMIDDCINACTNFYENTLTLDNMCWGYELALLFDQNSLQKYCEQKINENAEEIFRSNSFLTSKPNLLHHILQLESLKCDESTVFNGCIEWAKSACALKGLDEKNPKILRNELGELFYEIRFGEMTVEKFHDCYCKHEGLFSLEEFRDIIGMIASKGFKPDKFNRNSRKASIKPLPTDVLVCERINWELSSTCDANYHPRYYKDHTVFSSNSSLLLKGFHCSELFFGLNEYSKYATTSIPSKLTVTEIDSITSAPGNIICFRQMALSTQKETIIELPKPFPIKPGSKYQIEVVFPIQIGCYFNCLIHKAEVEVSEGVLIKFHDYAGPYGQKCERGLVTRLNFLKNNQ